MIYSIHAYNSDSNDPCFKGFRPDPHNPVDALEGAVELFIDNPNITLVMIRLWAAAVRFDQELGAIQLIRVPQSNNITARVHRLQNHAPHLGYLHERGYKDLKPLQVQLEFYSPQNVLDDKDQLLKYMVTDTPAIIVPCT